MKTNRQLEVLVIKTSFDMSAKDYPSGAPGTKSIPNLPIRDFSVSVRQAQKKNKNYNVVRNTGCVCV